MTGRSRHHNEPGADDPVAPFFLLIFVSWLLWSPAGARAAGVLPFPWPFEIALLGAFSPLIVAVVLIVRRGGLTALGVLPLAIIFAWLYDATGGSLLVCFLVHASFNMTSMVANAMWDGPVILGVIALLWLTVIAILLARGWRQFAGEVKDEAGSS